MAYHILDNVYTHTFTPREYQVELLDSIKRKNTIVCSSTGEAKTFIAVKLVQEYSWRMRSHYGKRALFILDSENISIMTTQVRLLTDLTVTSVLSIDNLQWDELLSKYSVIVLTADICIELILNGSLSLSNLVLLVIDDCLHGSRQQLIEKLMIKYDELDIDDRPRVLGLVAGLLSTELRPVLLEAEMQRLEKLLRSSVDTSSELVTLLRLCCRPKEHVVECALMLPTPLRDKLKHIIIKAKEFLADHRYDPSEIYSDELLEEFLKVPDPKQQPLEFLNDTLRILDDLGPWAVDQAALSSISLIEKLKVKVPYERHYLLLCMIFTVMLEIRAYCDSEFGDLEEKDKIANFSTPKVLRFLEIIKEFKPANYEKPPEPLSVGDSSPTDIPHNMGKGRKNHRGPKRLMMHRQQSDDNLCALVFVHNRMTAKVLFTLLSAMSQHHPDYYWVSTLYSVDKITDPSREPREAELEHRRQEEVLKKYRAHECNIMIATSVLEQGCDLPKCNLVVRFDLPNTFHSYLQSKARARLADAYYLLVVNENDSEKFVEKLGEYMEVEKTLLRRAYSLEPDEREKAEANRYNGAILPYQPLPQTGSPNVTLTTAIQLVNKYCAKLPSDTFTRLTPLWNIKKQEHNYVCTLRLPINSPVKQTVSSPPVVNCLLARRLAAFYTCKLLHQAGELDDMLQPVGKENFKASEDDWNHFPLEPSDEELVNENVEQRPGTTKRRQYYYKRVSNALLDCHPIPNQPVYFYRIIMTLTCPLPEEQNTRGRKIYPPEESPQGFGILTCKPIPQICPFPIFTRSGEVSISLELCTTNESLDDDKIHKIREFLNYTFTSVLRLQRYLMLFEPEKADSSYLIAPTITVDNITKIDWNFINLIYENRNILPQSISDEERVHYKFEPSKYKDAVVMPWYRNRDQPQYFYVAEICTNLNPKSAFPGSEYATFDEYYNRKYNIKIQNLQQHLLDVDHTSARLNFLTPRYVNRKGVALPTSSEETKRAKRENLEQKQILVPELCAVHPFPASLWRKAVCLPCILYRINALLLADQIRLTVANEMGLGEKYLPQDFKWPTLNFGWSLLEVLKKKPQDSVVQEKSRYPSATREKITEIIQDIEKSNSNDEEIEEIQNGEDDDKDWMEIGTWSNDMIDMQIPNDALVRYASPTSWLPETYDDFSDSDECYSDDESGSEFGGLHIEFMGDNIAEAVDTGVQHDDDSHLLRVTDSWENYNTVTDDNMTILKEEFLKACNRNVDSIYNSGIYIRKGSNFKKAIAGNSEKNQIPIENNVIINDCCPIYNSGTGDKIFNDKIQCLNDKLPFSFDLQPSLEDHPGPSPSVILQALTMSNANDGINLERLETIGDSFLKYAITDYLYSKYENVHEGKLSHLRSKQVSNLNLYRLGKRKNLGECMIATKFDPHDNWLPPCFYVPRELEEALLNSGVILSNRPQEIIDTTFQLQKLGELIDLPGTIPYNLVTQHSIPDKSIADCVEALIGAYLIECGPHGALLFMAWLGIRVLPRFEDGSYGKLENPKSPLLRHVPDPEGELDILLDGYDKFEKNIGYHFRDRAYLLQALTHASYSSNTLTDCYQRLEFLGDAVLDYLITRHLYEDSRMHSPGALTDLRSALVNNTIFASLAVRHGFHKYFRHLSPGLHQVVERFVRLQEESGHALAEELYLLAEHECEEVEDVEVPKALGDVFESIAGAIYLDSGRSLDAVWQVYYQMMKNEIEQFSDKVPKSPIRELLELEPETAKFGTPEKLVDGRRVRVTVEVFGKGIFKGIGRNYRIAKCTAAKCALKHLKKQNFTRRN